LYALLFIFASEILLNIEVILPIMFQSLSIQQFYAWR
jgi:hypothetical protein